MWDRLDYPVAWPRPLPPSWQGTGNPEPLPFIPVAPVLVAEVRADVAYEGGRYRHPIHFLRTRLDLEPVDLPIWTITGASEPQPR